MYLYPLYKGPTELQILCDTLKIYKKLPYTF